jgi:phosphohistidine phosphatase
VQEQNDSPSSALKMKKAILVRHAKSDWSLPLLDDIDRPLNQRGYTDAHRIAKEFLKTEAGTTLFVSSPAIRAISTALIFAREINFPPAKINFYNRLYEGRYEVYQDLLEELNDAVETVFVFGHNPGISRAIEELSGTLIEDVPTCAVNILLFETTSWKEIQHQKGIVEKSFYPKSLTD